MRRKIRDEVVFDTIMRMTAEKPDSNVRPEDIAIELYPEDWQSIIKRVRLSAKQLATEGYIHILRKGKPVDPDEAKGLLRYQIIPEMEYEIRTPEPKKKAIVIEKDGKKTFTSRERSYNRRKSS